MNPPDYLNPDIPSNMKRVSIPVVEATNESLQGYGCLVDALGDFKVEIVRWPAKGWRPVDTDTGDEAGTTEGVFVSEWRGDILYGRNEAVGGHYIRLTNKGRFTPGYLSIFLANSAVYCKWIFTQFIRRPDEHTQ
jgi:hypothetical protein